MSGRIVVSGGGRLRTFDRQTLCADGETLIPGCGALCAGGESVYAASDEERAVYHLDAKSLLPRGVYAGGPGMRALCVSEDGARLYVLAADADSVLMLDARTGELLLLARVGVNPQNMRLDDTLGRLIVAGGRDGCVYVLCAYTLELLSRRRIRGFCADAGIRNGRIRALGVAGERSFVPGKMIDAGEQMLVLDQLGERLFSFDRRNGMWRFVCAGARDAALTD